MGHQGAASALGEHAPSTHFHRRNSSEWFLLGGSSTLRRSRNKYCTVTVSAGFLRVWLIVSEHSRRRKRLTGPAFMHASLSNDCRVVTRSTRGSMACNRIATASLWRRRCSSTVCSFWRRQCRRKKRGGQKAPQRKLDLPVEWALIGQEWPGYIH